MQKRILVVEDDRDLGDLIEDYLYHFKVLRAETLEDALIKVENLEFDIVISDVRLHEQSGIEVVRVLRAIGESTPVILISGFEVETMPSRALLEGAFSFIEKPFTQKDICDAVEIALRKVAN